MNDQGLADAEAANPFRLPAQRSWPFSAWLIRVTNRFPQARLAVCVLRKPSPNVLAGEDCARRCQCVVSNQKMLGQGVDIT